jgi:hypothetical protein
MDHMWLWLGQKNKSSQPVIAGWFSPQLLNPLEKVPIVQWGGVWEESFYSLENWEM